MFGLSGPGSSSHYGLGPATGPYGSAPSAGQYEWPAASDRYGADSSGAEYVAGGGYGAAEAGDVRTGTGPAGQWPLRSELVLGALPGAVPCARLHARLLLWEWGLTSLADNVELIVSELATNALRASAEGNSGHPRYDAQGRQLSIGLRLAADDQQVLVEVWDSDPAPPAPRGVSGDGETGRGLLMVEAVSREWGYYYPPAQPPSGPLPRQAVKVVWALIQPS
jgi:anti-sigma regulatory factor (Ser/Thr protein kinase)